MSDISDALQSKALEPASVSVDGQSVAQRSIGDQVAADKYSRSIDALTSPKRALKGMTVKLVPPGAS